MLDQEHAYHADVGAYDGGNVVTEDERARYVVRGRWAWKPWWLVYAGFYAGLAVGGTSLVGEGSGWRFFWWLGMAALMLVPRSVRDDETPSS